MRFFLIVLFLFSSLYSQTIKDISNVIGIRENQLIGYGLIVGLAGTGDKSKFTMQSLQNLLRNSYIKIPAGSINSKNIAAVMVTAELPPFSRQGDKIKVKVSTIGDAKSVDNGELLITQLKGVDGNVYALAQGTIVANENNKTTGFIYDGATVENEIDYDLKNEDSIKLSLLKSSARNADLIETKINEKFKKKLATALDTRTIEVIRPENVSAVKFISMIENIELDAETFKKKVIVDMARESIITGGDIPINPVTIARDSFSIRIDKSGLSEDGWKDPSQNPGVDIGDNVMKLPMSEIIDTLKMIKEMGAIDVEIEVRG